MSNSNSRNLVPPAAFPNSSSLSVLLLECDDICEVLKTVAENEPSETGSSAKTGAKSGSATCKKITFVLTNECHMAMARVVLLIHLARILDSDLPADLDFFWGVWCNLSLTQSQLARLQKLTRKFLGRDAAQFQRHGIFFPNEKCLEPLREVWQFWCEDQRVPTLDRVSKSRDKYLTGYALRLEKRISGVPKPAYRIPSAEDTQKWLSELQSVSIRTTMNLLLP